MTHTISMASKQTLMRTHDHLILFLMWVSLKTYFSQREKLRRTILRWVASTDSFERPIEMELLF